MGARVRDVVRGSVARRARSRGARRRRTERRGLAAWAGARLLPRPLFHLALRVGAVDPVRLLRVRHSRFCARQGCDVRRVRVRAAPQLGGGVARGPAPGPAPGGARPHLLPRARLRAAAARGAVAARGDAAGFAARARRRRGGRAHGRHAGHPRRRKAAGRAAARAARAAAPRAQRDDDNLVAGRGRRRGLPCLRTAARATAEAGHPRPGLPHVGLRRRAWAARAHGRRPHGGARLGAAGGAAACAQRRVLQGVSAAVRAQRTEHPAWHRGDGVGLLL
mmetsp:Transcript_33078/g.106124  ORF Transcript_33078/g.106124 Transcript_33078/m.106124 type:complete len:278 (-) Transcript_33078:578-1411(-)